MEAFHYRYHALFEEALRLVRSGAVGDLVDVSAWFDVNLPDRTNIRYIQDLAGGSTMDLGCYSLHFARSIAGEEPEVVSATFRPSTDPRLDEALTAEVSTTAASPGRSPARSSRRSSVSQSHHHGHPRRDPGRGLR